LVIKADGLAAGKGVIIAESYAEGEAAVHTLLEEQGAIVIEEFMDGEEVSFFALTDGITAIPFGTAQDHKRVFDGDKGANTGGMGAYSPAPLENPAFTQKIMDSIIIPTVEALKAEGITYQGVLYAGLMVTKDGAKLLEYNARFGDPECEVLMLRLNTDIVEIMLSVAEQRLSTLPTPLWDDAPALCVVMASKGYPAAFQKGTVIKGVEALLATADTVVFHAGTARDENDNLTAVGGRVLVVSSKAATLEQAQQNAYKTVDAIQWDNGFCRRDIGWRALGV
jgi:phosphoribosylamine--glycine ligase